jgi:hypothetical protein
MYASVVQGINRKPRIGQRTELKAELNQFVKTAMRIITNRGKKKARIGIKQGI